MNLHREIEKATMIPKTSENSKFVRLNGLSQAIKDRMVNERHLKPPKNIGLLDFLEPESSEMLNTELCFNEHEIAASIKAVNGGQTYSNEDMEYYLRLRQQQGAHKEEDPDKTLSASDETSSTISDKVAESFQSDETVYENKLSEQTKETLDKMDVLRKCGLSRNAAIGGLFMQDKISIHDLLPMSTQDVNDLVPLPEDPEVFVQHWQAYGKLDPDKSRGIDFTVPRVGKKKTVTARQHFLTEKEDSSFAFVKKTHK